MGSFAHFNQLCRLCGTESQDLINLSENSSGERNLISVIKKYLSVVISTRDALPHQICGPCLAKLDEVVDFVDASHATQTRLKKHIKEESSYSNLKVNEEHLYKLIQDVKVELEETDDYVIDDDISDVDSEPRPRKKRATKSRVTKKRKNIRKGKLAGQTKKPKIIKESGSSVEGSEPKVSVEGADDPNTIEESATSVQKEEDALEGDDVLDEDDGLAGNEKTERRSRCPVRCFVCEGTFDSSSELAVHYKRVHPSSAIRFMCPQCPQSFLNMSSMNRHQRRKHQDLLQSCPKCKKCYPAHYLWTRHMLVHTNTRPFTCDECDKKFKSKAELTNHKRTHRPNELRYTHCCELCGKRFTQKANLESHLRLHTGSRPFSCEFCGKSFSQRGNMEEHRRIHTGEKPFVCHICGVRYSRQGQLAVHRKTHTGEKPHKCQYCDKEFIRKEVLRKHEHIHTDTRPYKCAYCEKWFRDQGKRKVHERLHTGERPFECEFCTRKFCESGNLKKHMRVHTRTLSATSNVRDNSQPSTVAAGNTGIPTGSRGHAINATSTSFQCPTGNSTGMANPPILIVPESIAFTGQDGHMSTDAVPSGSSSLSLQIRDPMAGSAMINNRTTDEQMCDAEERVDDYRVSSAVPFQSVAWALYHS